MFPTFDLRIASNNPLNMSLARDGDLVTIVVDSSEELQESVIAQSTVDGIDSSRLTIERSMTKGPETWEISYTVQPTDHAGIVTFSVRTRDLAGNSLNVTTPDSGSVTVGEKPYLCVASVLLNLCVQM